MTATTRSWAHGFAIAAAAGALLVGGAGAASAHVSVKADQAAAGSNALLTFSTAHGCEGSPTTKVAIQMPAGVNTVAPTVNPNWTVDKVTEKLASPVTDAHGVQITKRVDQVVYQAKSPLVDGFRETFTLQVPLPQDAAGQQLAFPTVQTCEEGETAWVQVADAGGNADELEFPAPTITVTAAGNDHHGAGHADPASPADAGQADPAAGDPAAASLTGGGGPWTTWGLPLAGLVAGLGGLAAGLLALVRTRPKAG